MDSIAGKAVSQAGLWYAWVKMKEYKENTDYEQIITYIENIPKFTKKNSLEHTSLFLDRLNVKTDRMKIIHVAGTNGKGSVCAMISNILVKCKKETGLFISPHLITHNERIRINNIQIRDDEFVQAFQDVKAVVDEMEKEGYSHPSYFEFLYLMAMHVFDEKQVEYVVLETGLGGRLDATNSIKHPLVTVITSIGLDHMEYLGDTVEEIAEEKAGIIKEGIPVVYWAEDKRVSEVIRHKAEDKHARIFPVKENNYKINKKTDKSVDFSVQSEYYLNDAFSVPFISEYQVQNAVLALSAAALIEDIRDNRRLMKEAVREVRWEGRMEIVRPGIIFDGAHNGPGIDAFIKTFQAYECRGRKRILFSVVRDKDYDYMVSRIAETDVSKVYITRIDSARGLEADRIKKDFDSHRCRAEIVIIPDICSAFKMALMEKDEEDALFCVGSLYLIGELKRYIQVGQIEI